jgi:hypothetical protein
LTYKLDMAIVKALAVACLLEADMNSEDTAIGAAGAITLLLKQARDITRGKSDA